MDGGAKTALARDIAGALDWWRDAGVDFRYREEPLQWLTAPEPAASAEAGRARPSVDAPPSTAPSALRAAPPQPSRPSSPPVDRSGWPKDLASFNDWWLREPSLDDGRTTGRVPPRGPARARLMIVVPQPGPDDTDHLLSAGEGRLLDAMLQAMGLTPDDAYVASALPRHTPLADWDELSRRGMGALLLHHVGLVGPERVILLGGGVLSLLGNDLPLSAAATGDIAHEERSIPLLGGRGLDVMLARPGWKADFWKKWLGWTFSSAEASQN